MNEYQERAMTTCMPSCDNFSYMMLNLVGEVGELASKVAKAIRKENAMIIQNQLLRRTEDEELLMLEAGDVLWQLSGLCKVMGWELEDIAQMNLDKLAKRKQAGTIDGSGDGIYNR
jgi:NTP pyrophosphatase (non-canonical NTP hydrolase)